MRHPQELLKFIKEQYPPGTRIRLTEMHRPSQNYGMEMK